jgi:hypothetical protein
VGLGVRCAFWCCALRTALTLGRHNVPFCVQTHAQRRACTTTHKPPHFPLPTQHGGRTKQPPTNPEIHPQSRRPRGHALSRPPRHPRNPAAQLRCPPQTALGFTEVVTHPLRGKDPRISTITGSSLSTASTKTPSASRQEPRIRSSSSSRRNFGRTGSTRLTLDRDQ